MHKTAVVRSVYHNGGCHKNMPMYSTGADKFRRKFKGQYDVFTYGAGYLNIAIYFTGFALKRLRPLPTLTALAQVPHALNAFIPKARWMEPRLPNPLPIRTYGII